MKFTGVRKVYGLIAAGVVAAGLAVTPGLADTTDDKTAAAEPVRKVEYDISPEQRAAVDKELKRWATANKGEASATALVYIPVYLYNFYDRDNRSGYLTGDQIWAQMRWLNYSFSGGQGGASTRFRFTLKGYNRVGLADHTVYFSSNGDPTTRTANLMRNYRKSGKGYLTMWTGHIAGGIAGVASFPWDQSGKPRLDGVWINKSAWRSTPEGPTCTRQGDTAVHEIGHWLGLYHTSTYPVCGTQRNYMSYGRDAYLNSFTSGQRDRMSRIWGRYRS